MMFNGTPAAAGQIAEAATYPLDAEAVCPGLDLVGAGPDRTIFQQATNGVNGLKLAGLAQYLDIRGFTVQYTTQQTRYDAVSAGLLLADGIEFSEVGLIVVRGACYGVRATSAGGHASEFNNRIYTMRVYGWWKAAYSFESAGSGSLHENLYASSVACPSVWRCLECHDFSGEFIRINLERSTVRDCVINLTTDHDVSFYGLHMEEISMIAKGFTPLDGSVSNALIRTTGAGVQKFDQWTIDTCHFGGYIVAPGGLTRSGTTAHAVLKLMGFQQKTISGHGIEVGDQIFIEGADTGTSNGYNGIQTVTAIGADWVEFTVAGSPATPSDIASGSDCVTVSLGDNVVNAVSIFYAAGNAGKIHVGNLHLRDIRVIGATASRRASMLRLMRVDANSTCPAELYIDRISTAGQRSVNSHWLSPRVITGYKRVSNVSTFYFDRPHNLRTDTPLHVYLAADATFNGVYTALTPVSRYAVSVTNAGSDKTLTRDTATRAIMRTAQIASVARSGNYATITTTADHGLYSASTADGVGLRVAIRADDSGYNTDDALILDVPSTTTFVVRNVGSDLSTTADAGSVMLIEGGLASVTLNDQANMGGPITIGELNEYCAVINTGAITSLATAASTQNVQRADTTRDTVELIGVQGRDGRLTYWGEVSATNQVQIKVGNPTAGSITPAVCVVRYRIVRS